MTQAASTTALPGFTRSALKVIAATAWLTSIFALAFLLPGVVFPFIAPPRFVPGLTPKLREVAEHRGKYDLLIFGSSRIFRGFVAPEFDRLMAGAGRPIHSFNMGVDGMSVPESFYTVRQALALGLRPKWMLIELWDLRTVAELRFTEIVRFVHWHDARHTALVIERIFRDDTLPIAEKLRRTAVHLYAALVRHAQRGQAVDSLQPLLNPPHTGKSAAEPTPWLATGGFSADTSRPFSGKKREDFEAAVATGKSAYRTIALPPTLRCAATELVRDLRAAGIEPVFVVPPTVHRGETFAELRPQGVEAALITFADPRRFPDLYRTDWHRDDMHLTEVGANALTAHFAEEFLQLPTSR